MENSIKDRLLKLFDKRAGHKSAVECNLSPCSGSQVSSTVSGLCRHLLKSHPGIYKTHVYKAKIANKKLIRSKQNNLNVNTGSVCSSLDVAIETDTQLAVQPINKVQNMDFKLNHESLKSCIMDFFVNKLHPMSMLNEGLFKYYIQPILRSVNVVLDMQSVFYQIFTTSNELKETIKLRIKNTMFALKIDLVVGAKLIILGIHIQHVFDKEIQLYTLSLQQIGNDTTDAQIRIMFLETLNNYKIDSSQILTTTTDINILDNIKTSFNEMGIVNSFKLACNDLFNSIGCTRTIPAMRLITKCTKRFLNNTVIESNLAMCHATVQKYNDLILKNNISSKIYFSVKPPFTCWKTVLEMVNNVLELNSSVGQHIDYSQIKLLPEHVIFLEELVKTFNSIQKVTIKLEDQLALSNNGFSNLYIVMMELKLNVEKIKDIELRTIFLAELEKLFALIMKDPIFLSSIYLDPRIRICLDANQTNEVKKFLTVMYKKLEVLKKKKLVNNIYITTPGDLTLKPTDTENNSPFQAYLELLETSRQTEVELSRLNLDFSSYELECIKRRFPMETNILEFWCSKQNSLTELAYAIQAIPITQVSRDRALFVYSYLISNNLVLSEVENQMFIKFNSNIWSN